MDHLSAFLYFGRGLIDRKPAHFLNGVSHHIGGALVYSEVLALKIQNENGIVRLIEEGAVAKFCFLFCLFGYLLVCNIAHAAISKCGLALLVECSSETILKPAILIGVPVFKAILHLIRFAGIGYGFSKGLLYIRQIISMQMFQNFFSGQGDLFLGSKTRHSFYGLAYIIVLVGL